MFEGSPEPTKIGVFTAVGSFFVALLALIVKFGMWIAGITREHNEMYQHMLQTKAQHDEFPLLKKDVAHIQEDQNNLVEEFRGLRKELQDVLKILIERNGG